MDFYVEGILYKFAFLKAGKYLYRNTVDKALYYLEGDQLQKAQIR